MIPWFVLALPLPALAILDKTHGVAPGLLSKYNVPKSGTWKCLDGSKTIPWTSVNDDYCDCADGSDEPGTGACADSTFYCKNAGHIGASISSSRVNDGLCEKECCDGSDEQPGACPNMCQEIGAIYQKKRAEELKTRKTGSKIRASYIVFAQKEKKRLEALVESSKLQVVDGEKEVARLKEIADHSDSLSAAALAHRKESPLYTSLTTHATALKSLKREHQRHLEREKALGDILDALRNGYNPNYQDMAVLEAVRGWEALAGLPRLGETVESEKEEGSDEEGSDEPIEADLKEGEWSEKELEDKLDSVLGTDYETLLFSHDKHVASPAHGSILFDITSYIPDSLLPQYESLRENVLGALHSVGLASAPISTGTDTSRAREALNNAQRDLDDATKEHKTAEEDLGDLFDPEGFGALGEWKKLDGTCIETESGDYTYEVCLFGEAKQKPLRGGSQNSLGHFASWNNAPGVKVGSPEYYSKQVYKNGAQCWNGPQRSVTLVWTCGTENAIHTVAEPEKCEYQFTGTSPALCLPLEIMATKEEL